MLHPLPREGRRIGKLFANLLSKMGFGRSLILNAENDAGEVPIELACAFPGTEVLGLDLSDPLLELAQSSTEKAGLSDHLSM